MTFCCCTIKCEVQKLFMKGRGGDVGSHRRSWSKCLSSYNYRIVLVVRCGWAGWDWQESQKKRNAWKSLSFSLTDCWIKLGSTYFHWNIAHCMMMMMMMRMMRMRMRMMMMMMMMMMVMIDD